MTEADRSWLGGVLRVLRSVRTTVALLCALGVLLVLNVAVPQSAVVGEEAFEAIVEGRPAVRFFLVTLGLGHFATSPLFLVVLTLFFLNLGAVILVRLGPTWRRSRPRQRSEAGLRAWARASGSVSAPLPEGWSPAAAVDGLRSSGYRVRRAGERTLRGLKGRTAPLGFILFHSSFFVLFGGGLLLYQTRFVGKVFLIEGQTFAGGYSEVSRMPPRGGPPALAFTLIEVDPRFEEGHPVHLGASLLFPRGSAGVRQEARVNGPARWGNASVLVQEAGLAAQLWLQDEAGFTLERRTVPARSGDRAATPVSLADGRYVVLVSPGAEGPGLPVRGALGSAEIAVQAFRKEELVFDGVLRPGGMAELGDDRLLLEEVRYWAGLLVVAERGGGLLVTGFGMAVAGLLWRLLLYRREVVVAWDENEVRLVGSSEYYPSKMPGELRALLASLSQAPAAGGVESHLLPSAEAEREG